MEFALSPANYDDVVSALTGNGELCTTLSPTGYHVAPEHRSDIAHWTQFFVMAGRRRSGPQHPLIDFGTISRSLMADGKSVEPVDWRQTIDWPTGAVVTEWNYPDLVERTRSFVALADNAFLADTALTNTGDVPRNVVFRITYRFGDSDAEIRISDKISVMSLAYRVEDHLGDVQFSADRLTDVGELSTHGIERGAETELRARLEPGESAAVSVLLHFSDRMHFEFPLTVEDADAVAERHESAWRDFWARSEVVTGDDDVDAFRLSSLYTLRCQATPWSIPPTLSHPYWGAGTFHDEMYPFFGLLSSNYPELAERIPYFRLATLPQAQARARGRGALYPWSSTEQGEERDPNGLWLTERFHLGQFAVCIHALWLYERDRVQLDDLYPVLRDLARYFEMNMLEKDVGCRASGVGQTTGSNPQSAIRTRECVDFDESVGTVTNGPFTISAAIASMEYAAEAAGTLWRDSERATRWRELAAGLRENLPQEGERYAIPDDKPLHYSILGPVFPFRVDVGSERARASARHIHETFRSTRGWKPGFSEVFRGSNWMWMAGHLGIVHAMQGNADLAWEAVKGGTASAGPLLSPNEHVDSDGEIQAPWFTTGCGGWLYALNTLFVQVDEAGTILLSAVPSALPYARFRDLRAHGGVLVSGEFADGELVRLTARSPVAQAWTYRIPRRYGAPPPGPLLRNEGESVAATARIRHPGSESVASWTVELRSGEQVSLLG